MQIIKNRLNHSRILACNYIYYISLFSIAVLLLVCSLAVPIFSTGVENGFISFKFSKLAANEDSNADFTTVSLPFIREVGSSGSVVVTFEVSCLVQCNLGGWLFKIILYN